MTRRTCPACQRRYAGLVDPACAVCGGFGVLHLGAAALHDADPPVVARAIGLYLEGKARAAHDTYPIGPGRTVALADAVTDLRLAGILTPVPPGRPPEFAEPTPDTLYPATRAADAEAYALARAAGAHLTPATAANLDAEPILYGTEDRPLATGLLPTVSAAGSPSCIARTADPKDALGSTRADTYARLVCDRKATVMAGAVDRTVTMRARRQNLTRPRP